MWRNKLYFGDNLEILRKHVGDESVDLVYLDPPFNSKADYNVLFKNTSGEASAAQATAFKDTWEWDEAAAEAYHDLITSISTPRQLKNLMEPMKLFLTGDTGKRGNSMMAYLTMMALRLVELHRVLKPTGSLYLHCDPTASHYIKVILDAVFDFSGFRNELIWKRTSGHSDASRFGSTHDVLLYYAKSEAATWNQMFQPYEESYVDQYYRYTDADGRRFMSGDASAAGLTGGGYDYEWHGHRKIWRYPLETMHRLEAEGRLYYTRNGVARTKRYLDESSGMPVQDVITDIQALRSWHQERLGYPTQKPEELLERLMLASSNEGDVVLDPFCGCGTTIAVAEKLKRRWIGIDVTTFAVDLMERRLVGMFSPQHTTEKLKSVSPVKRRKALKQYWETGKDDYGLHLNTGLQPFEVLGIPQDLDDAKFLFEKDPIQFEYWCVGMVGAQPNQKKGADKGIDGVINFLDMPGDYHRALVSVKGGANRQRENVATLKGDMEREKATLGILITLHEPTPPMKEEAANAGRWDSEFMHRSYPRIQLITVRQLLDGFEPDLPKHKLENFKVAQKVKIEDTGQASIFEEE